ncbi:MAG: hypothetical protein NTW54_04610 [Bacteroidetes bacterium]|nr:hypothetical protein [Bacteroidota bacterium]
MKKTATIILLICAIFAQAQNTNELLISNKPEAEITNVMFYNNKCYAELKETDSKYWLQSSISSIAEIDANTLAYHYILNRDTTEVSSDICFQKVGSKLYCFYLSYKINLKKIYLQEIEISNNLITHDSVLMNLPIFQTGNNSLIDFLRYKSKVTITNNEVFSKVVYRNDTTQLVEMNVRKFDATLTSLWEINIKAVDAWIYSNSSKTIVYYLLGQGKLNIKIYDKTSQAITDASFPILDIIPFNSVGIDFMRLNQKDYMVIINDSNNNKTIDNTYFFSFPNDSSLLLEKTFTGGKRIHCFSDNDSLFYFVLGSDSTNHLSIYNNSFSPIGSSSSVRNKNGNRIAINNYKKNTSDYWYFGCYFSYPNYYPYVAKTSVPLLAKDRVELVNHELKIYPNPTHQFFNINIPNAPSQIVVVNQLGQASTIYRTEQGYDIRMLGVGLFFIDMEVDGKRVTAKVWVNH